jgi:hypothetical protein
MKVNQYFVLKASTSKYTVKLGAADSPRTSGVESMTLLVGQEAEACGE